MIDETTTGRIPRHIEAVEDPFGIDATRDEAYAAAHAREAALRLAAGMNIDPADLITMAKWLLSFRNGAAWPCAASYAVAVVRDARPFGIEANQEAIVQAYAFMREGGDA